MCIECLFIHYPCPRSSTRCDQVLFLFTLISHNLQGGLDRNKSTLEFFRIYPCHLLSRNYHRSVFLNIFTYKSCEAPSRKFDKSCFIKILNLLNQRFIALNDEK